MAYLKMLIINFILILQTVMGLNKTHNIDLTYYAFWYQQPEIIAVEAAQRVDISKIFIETFFAFQGPIIFFTVTFLMLAIAKNESSLIDIEDIKTDFLRNFFLNKTYIGKIEPSSDSIIPLHSFKNDLKLEMLQNLYKSDLNFSKLDTLLDDKIFNLINQLDLSKYEIINNNGPYLEIFETWKICVSSFIFELYKIPFPLVRSFVNENSVAALRLALAGKTHGCWSVGIYDPLDSLILSGFIKNPEFFAEPLIFLF
jgi:hypothetical protein